MADDKTAREKTREQARAWREANRETIRAQKKAYREGSKREQVLAGKKAYYAKHRERQLAQQKAKREADEEGFRAHRRKRYAAEREQRQAAARARYAADPKHAERVRANNRKYRTARIDEFRQRERKYAKAYQQRDVGRFRARMNAANHKRRALKLGAFVEAIDPMTVFRRGKGVCGICRLKIDPKSKWHVDHVVPLSKGGVHSYDNVQPAHARCNWSKRDTMPVGQIGLFQKHIGGVK